MCGIALQFSPGGKAKSFALEMLRHRGPDACGEWRSADGACWLGHTRLSILDPSPNGAQPMVDPDTGSALIFNGEIYNHRILRARLPHMKGRWRGESDTETILAGYRRWGRALPSRLKGMFAFALYDAEAKLMLIARDRFGIKPVYYVWQDGSLSVASEVRALLALTSMSYTPDSVSAYLSNGACPEENLLWSRIRCVPPGHLLELHSDGMLVLEQYWGGSLAPVKSNKAPAAHVRELLEYSVEDHLQADVPVASFLSGGIDSSVITALAAQKLSHPLLTFSVGFRQKGFDETAIAAEVARRYRTEHHRIELGEEETVALVREAVSKLDLPSVDAINTYIVASVVARHGIKVALGGLGGDELFGGYPVFRDIAKFRFLARLPWALRPLLGLAGSWGKRFAEMPSEDLTGIIRWRRRFFTGAETEAAGLAATSIQTTALPAGLPDDFAVVSWAELRGYMRDMLLRDADQMSMAVSLELRVPFLDHDLVEYLLRLPAREKRVRPGIKGLLVDACRDLLPSSVYRRPKMGFGLPMDDWLRGPLETFAAEGVDQVHRRGILKPEFLTRLQRGFECGAIHWTRLWSVAVLGHYLEKNSNADRLSRSELTEAGREAVTPAPLFSPV